MHMGGKGGRGGVNHRELVEPRDWKLRDFERFRGHESIVRVSSGIDCKLWETFANFFSDWLRFLQGCFHRCLAQFWVDLYSATGFNQIPPRKTLFTER